MLQHNVLRWISPRKQILANQYLALAPDVILINAHGCTDDDKITIYPYKVFQQNRNGRAHDGVAIAVRPGLNFTIMRDFVSETLAVSVETAQGKVTLATSYLPPLRPYVPAYDFNRLAALPHPTYLIGDLNGRHRILGYHGQ